MALAASAPIGLFVATERDGVVLVNDCFEEITGRREEELLGDGWIATVHPDDRSRVIEETARLQSDTSVEHRMLRPDGTVRYVAPALRLENSLHRAVAREEFRVFFQPVVELAKGACLGVEALAQWQHPERGHLVHDVLDRTAEASPALGLNPHRSRSSVHTAETLARPARNLPTPGCHPPDRDDCVEEGDL